MPIHFDSPNDHQKHQKRNNYQTNMVMYNWSMYYQFFRWYTMNRMLNYRIYQSLNNDQLLMTNIHLKLNLNIFVQSKNMGLYTMMLSTNIAVNMKMSCWIFLSVAYLDLFMNSPIVIRTTAGRSTGIWWWRLIIWTCWWTIPWRIRWIWWTSTRRTGAIATTSISATASVAAGTETCSPDIILKWCRSGTIRAWTVCCRWKWRAVTSGIWWSHIRSPACCTSIWISPWCIWI